MKYLLIVYAVMSFLAFILYGVDKFKAKRGLWRIPERVLLGFALLGGAVGALVGMNLFRHKTKHWYFWAVSIIGLILQIALAIAVLMLL